MKLSNWKAAAVVELRKWRTWASTALLAALPFAADIKNLVAANLPTLQPYLPENVYKFMGAAVVITGMVLSFAASHRLVKATNESGNS